MFIGPSFLVEMSESRARTEDSRFLAELTSALLLWWLSRRPSLVFGADTGLARFLSM